MQNAQRGVSNVVLLTSLGGGAFDNDESWIIAAMRLALEVMREIELDTKLDELQRTIPGGRGVRVRPRPPVYE